MFAFSERTPSRSTLDHLADLTHDVTEKLIEAMRARLMAAHCVGLADTHFKRITPKVVPDERVALQDSRIQRLLEKIKEAQKDKKDGLDTKFWVYFSFDTKAPYDLFDFRASRHRDGPVEHLQGYTGNVMADGSSRNTSVLLAPGSKMPHMGT